MVTLILAVAALGLPSEDSRLKAHAQLSADEAAELWSRVEGCPRAIETAGDETRQEVEGSCALAVFRLLVGAEPDQPRLWRLYEGLPQASLVRWLVLSQLLDERVRETFAGLPEPEARELRTEADGVERQLASATALYERVRSAGRARLEALREGSKAGFQEREHEFEQVLADAVRGRISMKAAEAQLARFTWTGMCGTGAEIMIRPQLTLVLLSALEDERWLVAASALSDIQSWAEPDPRLELSSIRPRLLALAGVDWESHEVGAAIAGRDLLAHRALGERGSERAARLLLASLERARAETAAPPELDAEPRPAPREDAFLMSVRPTLHALAAFVPRAAGCEAYGTERSDEIERRSTEAISDATQQRILSLLAANVGPDSGSEEAEPASHLLVRLCRPESRAAFEGMMRSPFGEVRQRGFIGLRALGEDPEPPLGPQLVRFALTVDGRPFASQAIEWSVEPSRHIQSSRTETDAGGRLAINRDLFVDPKAPVDSLRIATEELESADAPWFSIEQQAPADLGEVVPLRVATQRLTIRLAADRRANHDLEHLELRIGLQARGMGESVEIQEWVAFEAALSPKSPLVFQRLQRGRRYQVMVRSADDLWRSEELSLDEAPGEIVIPAGVVSGRPRR